MTVNGQQYLSWCSWVAAAIDAYPMAKARWAENAARSDLIKSAVTAMEQGDLDGCNSILSDLFNKTEWDESKHHRDQRGRFSAGAAAVAEHASRVAHTAGQVAGVLTPRGQPAKLSAAVSNTAGRIANVARELEGALRAIRHLRGGSADADQHVVSLAAALRGLHRELGQLATATGQLGHEGKAALLGARDRLRRLRDTLRAMRGGRFGKSAPSAIKATGGITIAARLTKAEVARRDMLQHRIQLLRDQLAAAHRWQPLQQEAHHERIQ